jgi:hypothetical protein
VTGCTGLGDYEEALRHAEAIELCERALIIEPRHQEA